MPRDNDCASFSRCLLRWYQEHRRELPWREHITPYKTLIAEIMLQQTRVEAVIPLFREFIQAFPTITDLAAATEEQVLSLWQGLGYYSRARRLHQTARIIAEEHGGKIPQSRQVLLNLPGIGAYTAAAIRSIAFGCRETAVDGNLLRIGSRVFLVQDSIQKSSVRQSIAAAFDKLIPSEQAGDFNQALMDLGSSLCIPRNPRCGQCPVRVFCRAYQESTPGTLPNRGRVNRPKQVTVSVMLIQTQEALLMRQRHSGTFLQGMWELPWFEGSLTVDAADQTTAAEGAANDEQQWLQNAAFPTLPHQIWTTDYMFTHRHWTIHVFHYEMEQPFRVTNRFPQRHYRWQPQDQLSALALPTVFKKILQQR